MASKLGKLERDFYRNKEFYKAHTYGDNVRHPDTRYRYTVRTIGAKQAVLERVGTSGRYGHTVYLYTEEEAQRGSNQRYPRLYPTRWSQVLIPLGNDGWDPEINF